MKKGDHALVKRGGDGGVERFESYLGVKTNITCSWTNIGIGEGERGAF